jgi:hypothetical protein
VASKKKITPIDYVKMYQEVFGTPSGQQVLMDMCNRFHMMGATRKAGDVDGDMEFREGQRNVMLYVLTQVNYDLEKFFKQREDSQIEVQYDR